MLRIRLLGELEIQLDGVAHPAPSSRPARALLGWLALHPGMHRRAQLAARLWPDVLDASARASLRTTLHALRAALGSGGARYLLASRDEVGLSDDVWVDLHAFDELVERGELAEALALRAGELLAGFEEDWAWQARDRHREAVGGALERLAALADAAGDHVAGLRWTREQVELDPLSEERNRSLIERLWRAGDRSAAAAVYERLRDRMRSELRVAPSAQTRELVERLREDGPEATAATSAAVVALPPALDRRRRSRFVGRTAELARIAATFDAARAGERRLVAIAGEPGIGKSRIAREFSRSAHERGAIVLFGRCLEEPLLPYQPFVEALRPFGSRLPPELTAGSGVDGADAHGGGARWRLFEAVDALIGAVGERAPVVLALDDLHWADRPTLALLGHLLRSPQPAPLLVLGTHRSSDLDRAHPLAALLTDLTREELVERVELRGLGRAEVGELMLDWVGVATRAELDGTLLEDTQGNPFFVEELLSHFAESGALRPVPETVKDVIARRLERFSTDATTVLAAAAVAGREFELELLEALPELAGREPLVALEDACAAQMVREDALRPGRYEFTHTLIRESLYEELSAARRARLHGSLAASLEALRGAGSRAHLGELAHHFLEAGSPRAVDAALDAAQHATAKLAYEEAALWCERALAALERAAADGEPPTRRSANLLLALGQARHRAGESPAARTAFARAADVARELADSELLGHAALGFSGFGVSIIAVDDASVALLREALDAGPPDDALTARLVARLAVETYYASVPEQRKQLGDRAVALARASGDDGALLDALDARHVALWSADYLAERLATADEMIALARRANDPEREVQGRNWRVLDLAERGDVAEMMLEVERHEALADRLRLPAYQWWGPMWRSTIALLEGRLDDAERLIEELAAIGRRAHDDNAALYVEIQSHGLALERERFDLPGDEMLERQAGRPAEAAYRCGYAWLYAGQGRDGAARANIDWVARDGLARLPDDMNRLPALCELAQASVLLVYPAHAAAIYAQLAPYAERNTINARAAAGYGAASHHLAVLATLIGDRERAAAHFEDALAANERMGARPWLVRTQLRFAELLHERGDAARAGALLEHALGTATALRLDALAQRVRDAQAQLAAP